MNALQVFARYCQLFVALVAIKLSVDAGTAGEYDRAMLCAVCACVWWHFFWQDGRKA